MCPVSFPLDLRWLYLDCRCHDSTLLVGGNVTADAYRLLAANIGGGCTCFKNELARLDDEAHLLVIKGQTRRMDGEDNTFCLAGSKRHTRKAEQLLIGACNGGDEIAAIELHNLVAFTATCIAYIDCYRDRLGGICSFHREVAIGEAGVAQAMTEREERCGGRVNIISKEHCAVTTCTHA